MSHQAPRTIAAADLSYKTKSLNVAALIRMHYANKIIGDQITSMVTKLRIGEHGVRQD